MDKEVRESITKRYEELNRPHKRRALSLLFPGVKTPILLVHQYLRKIDNRFKASRLKKQDILFKYNVARHKSLLMRKLGDSDPRLQKQKVKNLRIAGEKINNIVIPPGKTFSFWTIVGKPTKEKGYVEGMLLSDGKVIEGIGGGLCQLSNLLYWLFLHSPVKVIERHHHSMDVFPDSGRVIPFGSGATIMYNFIDLKVKNTSKEKLQIRIWLTDNHLNGQILSEGIIKEKYHVLEKNHLFANKGGKYFRFNEIWRQTITEGKILKEEKITENFAPVLYKIDKDYIDRNKLDCIDL